MAICRGMNFHRGPDGEMRCTVLVPGDHGEMRPYQEVVTLKEALAHIQDLARMIHEDMGSKTREIPG